MTTIRSLEDLKRFREAALEKKMQIARQGNVQVIIGMGSCGIAAGALETMKAIREQIESDKLQGVTLTQSGCIGLCSDEPIVQVVVGEKPVVTYGAVTPEVARQIMKDHVLGGKVVSAYLVEV